MAGMSVIQQHAIINKIKPVIKYLVCRFINYIIVNLAYIIK